VITPALNALLSQRRSDFNVASVPIQGMIMRKLLTTFVILLLCASSAPASLTVLMWDDCDDVIVVLGVSERKDVVPFRQKLDTLRKTLYPLKEHDFIALFGKSQERPEKTYAMPVAQFREYHKSGFNLGAPNRKDHTEFYIVKDMAGLEVHYGPDGVSPSIIVFCFHTDKDFPKLTEDNLAKRLAWDEDHIKKLIPYVEKRMAEVFPWEIDQKELAKFHQADYAFDAKARLEAWIESGKRLGYTYKHKEGSNAWHWYRPNGKLARFADHGGYDDIPPIFFTWYDEDGISEVRKDSIFITDFGKSVTSNEWYRPKEKVKIRHESTSSWYWYDKNGKAIRTEWDDNGDGIPDWYLTKEDDVEGAYYRDDKEKRKPLKLEESWAINPKLIPEESRISDQPELRVPIRRKVVDKATKD